MTIQSHTKLINKNEASKTINVNTIADFITHNFSKPEIAIYVLATSKAYQNKKLSLGEVKFLDKFDATTMEKLGFCMKDSVVTLARLKACKRFNINFTDRDGLIDHMNLFLN